MKPKRIFLILFLPFAFIPISQTSFAQLVPPSINAVPLPVGSGARALGQGGAFIAVADDATAASWNPGGLTQLERPEFSIVGSFLSTHQDFDPGSTGLSLGNEEVSRGDLNYASVAYPFKVLGKNLVAALNYQQKYDFHMRFDIDQTVELPDLEFFDKSSTDFKSRGGVGALTPAVALQVIPRLSLGIAVNIYTDEFFGDFAWKETIRVREKGSFFGAPFSGSFDGDETFKNFQAVNVTAGLLLDIWEKEDKRLTFGAVFHSPYTADVDRVIDSESVLTDETGTTVVSDHIREHLKIDFPVSFGAGLGFRYDDALSFSMDVTWTDWSKFEQEDEQGNKFRPLGGISTDRDIDDTYAVRFGTEYLIFRQKMIIPLRGGLFYDPRPSLDDPTDVYGFSAGSGVTFKRFSIDGAYQFRWANNVDGEDFGRGLNGTHFDLEEHLFLASVIVYF